MKKILLFSILILMFALSACNGGPGGGPVEEEAPAEPAGEESTGEEASGEEPGEEAVAEEASSELAESLSVYNWADYIDEELITAYEEEYGVDIIYDTFGSNEDLLAKLQAGATGYDVIFPSDYMVGIMIDLGLLAEIDTSQLSNYANLDAQFLDAPFDPGNAHCVPYQWGTTGIGFRAGNEYFEENTPDTWAYLFEPEKLAEFSDGGVNVLNDPRELVAAALIYLGFDPNSENQDELYAARDLILAAKPYWKTFNSEDYEDNLLVADEVIFTHGWSGDVAAAYWNTYDDDLEDGNWYYSIPEEGAIKWLDNICITASSERHATAIHFMNYLLDAEVGAAITNYTYYGSPNKAAEPFILEEILADESIYPPADVQANLHWLVEPSPETTLLLDEIWTTIKSSQ